MGLHWFSIPVNSTQCHSTPMSSQCQSHSIQVSIPPCPIANSIQFNRPQSLFHQLPMSVAYNSNLNSTQFNQLQCQFYSAPMQIPTRINVNFIKFQCQSASTSFISNLNFVQYCFIPPCSNQFQCQRHSIPLPIPPHSNHSPITPQSTSMPNFHSTPCSSNQNQCQFHSFPVNSIRVHSAPI